MAVRDCCHMLYGEGRDGSGNVHIVLQLKTLDILYLLCEDSLDNVYSSILQPLFLEHLDMWHGVHILCQFYFKTTTQSQIVKVP